VLGRVTFLILRGVGGNGFSRSGAERSGDFSKYKRSIPALVPEEIRQDIIVGGGMLQKVPGKEQILTCLFKSHSRAIVNRKCNNLHPWARAVRRFC
jgi:hypothetical protein